MDYVIFDLEWNQPYSNDISFMKRSKAAISGEIIQIGAVKLNEHMELIDKFSVIIKPKYLQRMHRYVEDLTGITNEDLRRGVSFGHAYELFDTWCGAGTVLLTWGVDDVLLMRENLQLHGLPVRIKRPWYDAQLIYAYETYGTGQQCSLTKAMEEKGIFYSDLEAHQALHDAIFTARVCGTLDLANSIANYEKIRAHGNQHIFFPRIEEFFVYENFTEKKEVFEHRKVRAAFCPFCKSRLNLRSTERLTGDKYLSLGRCPHHGKFAVQWKIGKYMARGNQPRFYVAKSLSASTPEIEHYYAKKSELNRLKEEKYLARMAALRAEKEG